MRFTVGDSWRIASDSYSWRVQRYAGVYKSGARMNQAKWITVKYCSSLGRAVRVLADLMILEADTDTAPAALVAVKRVADAIEVALDTIEARL